MEPFIRNDQYNFIKNQTQILINGYTSVNDQAVLRALKSLALEKVMNLFDEPSEEQNQLLAPLVDVKDKDLAEAFLAELKPFVIPFAKVTQQTVKKLFPKAKKLKAPLLNDEELKEITYLGWDDKGSQKKFIVARLKDRMVGLQGTFKPINKKGICALCNKFEEVGMFLSETKGVAQGTYTKRGNYICQDSQKCNQNISSLDKLTDFIDRAKGRA